MISYGSTDVVLVVLGMLCHVSESHFSLFTAEGEGWVRFERLTAKSGRLAATRMGDGELLIVPVHGWTCRRSHWAGQLPLLANFGEVLALDLPGHGDSALTPPLSATISGLAEELGELVAAQQRGRDVVLLGHSMGGAVALEAARLLTNVRAVVLVDTFVIPYGDLPEAMAIEIEQSFATDFVGAMHNLVETNCREDLAAALKAQLHHDMASADVRWALPLWGDLLRWQPQDALSQPNTSIYAINGSLIPDAARVRCASHLHEVVIADARHFPQLEAPQRFNQELETIMRAVTGM